MLRFRKQSLFLIALLFTPLLVGVIFPERVSADDPLTTEQCEGMSGIVTADGKTCQLGDGALRTTRPIRGVDPLSDSPDALTETECRSIGGIVSPGSKVCQLGDGALRTTRPLKEDPANPSAEGKALQDSIAKVTEALCITGPISVDDRAKECASIKSKVNRCDTQIRGLVQDGGEKKATDDSALIDCLEKELSAVGISRDQITTKLAEVTIVGTGSSGGGTSPDPTCGTTVPGIGWAFCPVTDTAITFADTIWSMFEALLDTPPLVRDDSSWDGGKYYETWQKVRDIANALFAVVFLMVIFSQISNIGISNYGIKKMLPRLLIAAIAINLSFFIVQIAVDLSNLLGANILGVFNNLNLIDLDPSKLGWRAVFADILTNLVAPGALIWGGAIAVTSGFTLPLLLLLAALLIPAIIGLLAGLFALIMRSALIPILAILAPLAIVAYAFPNGQGIFDRWRKTFTSLLLLYPLAAIYYGGLKFVASLMIGTEGILNRIVGHALLYAGTFVVLGLALKGNAIVGKIYGAAQNFQNKMGGDLLRKGALVGAAGTGVLSFMRLKNRGGLVERKGRTAGFRNALDKISGVSGARKLVAKSGKWYDDRRKDIKLATDRAGTVAEDTYDEELVGDYAESGTLTKRALDITGGDEAAAKTLVERKMAEIKEATRKKYVATLSQQFIAHRANPAINSATNRPMTDDEWLLQEATRERDANNNEISASHRDAAVQLAAQLGRNGVIEDLNDYIKNPINPLHNDNDLRRSVSDAVTFNASALQPKAPHLVKGEEAAFSDTKGHEVVNYHKRTMGRYGAYLENDTSGPESARALLSAVRHAAQNPDLEYGPGARDALIKSLSDIIAKPNIANSHLKPYAQQALAILQAPPQNPAPPTQSPSVTPATPQPPTPPSTPNTP